MPQQRTVQTALSILKTALDTAEKAANLSSVPMVKPVIELAGALLDVVESVRRNKEDCESIGEISTTLVMAIVNSLSGKDEKFIDQDLKRQIQELGSKLVDIKNKLERISTRSTWRRVSMYRADIQDIKDCRDQLVTALQVFQVENNISQRVVEATHHHQITALIMDMGRVQVSHEFTVFSELPPAPPVFYGRDEYVTHAVTLILTKQPARLAILGTGGIGKTSVALAILHHPEIESQFGSSRHFVPCDSITTPAALVNMLLQVLKVQRGQEDPLACLLQFLRNSDRLLLVLDNFETPWDIEETRSEIQILLSHLAAANAVTLLITMRGIVLPNGLLWSQPALPHLTAFDAEAARATYLAHCAVEDSYLDDLLRELDYVPLAVTLMASIAQSDASTPTLLLRTWKQYYTTMLKTSNKDRLTNVELSISLSIRSMRMQQDVEAQQLLALICTLPDGIFHDRWNVIITFFESGDMAAQTLRHSALAYEDKSRKLQVLSPIRHYVQKHLQLSSSLNTSLQQLYIQLASLGYGLAWQDKSNASVLTEEAGNLTHILSQLLDSNLNEETIEAILGFCTFLYWTHPGSAMSLLEKTCHRLAESNRCTDLTRAQCLRRLGGSQVLVCEFIKAQENLSNAKEQFDVIGDQLGGARCLERLGHISMALNQYETALGLFTKAKEQFNIVEDKTGVAMCLRSLGDVALMCNQPEIAFTQLTEAKKQFDMIGDRLRSAQCLSRLGALAIMCGQYDTALAQLTEAKQQLNMIGDRLGVAHCLMNLGDVARMCNQYELAFIQLTSAKEQFEILGNKIGVADSLRTLGQLSITLNQFDKAITQLKEAKEHFDIIGNRLGTGQCLQSLSEIALMCSQYDVAQAQLREARELFNSIDNRSGIARCLYLSGQLAKKLGNSVEAENQFQAAKVGYEMVGNLVWAEICQECLHGLEIGQEEA